ncbi:MAG: hypothetical protein H7X88_10595, partial [Gloeobacteraceae cyanobacterium ES-bin-316]|nr:hypothetical protein [Ferruginibacter sp.]
MLSPLRYMLFCCCLLIGNFLNAQKITGTWEGYMNEEFIQINIEQKGNELCGYTYDYELRNRASHCRATFSGRYDPEEELFFISGNSFMENSGSHVSMRIILWYAKHDGRTILAGQVYTGGMPAYF